MIFWLRSGGTCPIPAPLPLRHLLENNALPTGAILTHMNVLAEEDWALLAERPDFSIAHCPNCHAYFERPAFPMARFSRERFEPCLGTDSLASNKALNLFEEMRAVRKNFPKVPPEAVLDMVTRNAARAIGMAGQLGEIIPGALADLIAVPYVSGDAVTAVIENRREISWMMISGKIQST